MPPTPASLTRTHLRRLRETCRSAGWPVQDVIEAELLVAGLLERIPSSQGPDSYLDVGGQCWYVLGCDRKGQPIAPPDHLVVARPAPKRPVADLPFALWMALAKTAPLPSLSYFSDESSQTPLALVSPEPPVPDAGGSNR